MTALPRRVLIANRGEIALRIAATLRRLGISPATIHAPDDAGAMHVAAGDVALEVPSYLDAAAVAEAARRAGADALHPGYGFLSERAELARACADAGVVWIGPPPEAIELMGDKTAAKDAAERAGVPVVPGLHRAGLTDEEIVAFAQDTPLPLLVKAAAGGGGKGMRVVSSLDELSGALEAARREAVAAFGDGELLVERYVAPARHLEVQVLADAHGNVVSLGERECSLQRRHQKVLEEAPSPVVDEALRARLGEEAVSLARACGYVGAGTVEFVAQADDPAQHWFLEMNTRLQVEHPVTELTRGLDLVEWQVRVAAGEELPDGLGAGAPQGHAIEARVYAEDPARGFLPATGTVRGLRWPRGEGVRVDAGVESGREVSSRYDPMLAKVIAHAPTREEAIERLDAALADTTLLGLRTNVAFLREVLADEGIRAGDMDTTLLERREPAAPDPAAAERAALVSELGAALERRAASGSHDPFTALAGWRVSGVRAAHHVRLRVDGEHDVDLAVPPPDDGLVRELPDGRLSVTLDGEASAWSIARDGATTWVGTDGASWLVAPGARALRGAEADGDSALRAPMPGSVIAVALEEGAEVARGDVVCVLESMKMELSITAPIDGTLAELRVAAGDQVKLDDHLATVHPKESA